jgi:putative membrane protein
VSPVHAGRAEAPIATRAAAASLAVAAAGMVATPLRRRGERQATTAAVVGGLFAGTTALVAHRWGARRAAIAATTIPVATALVERFGTTTGVPFGRYRYTGALRPAAAGVPVVVPLAWFAMAVPAREVAQAVLLRHRSGAHRRDRIVLGAACLSAWDLFLDPQMVGEGYWSWRRPGRYRGIPATNFLGWLLTGAAVMLALEHLLPVVADDPPDPSLAGIYGGMAVMEALAFAAFFRDPLVTMAGAAAMLPPAAVAARAVRAARRARGGGDG